jgi:hypothetical protein
MSQETRMKLVHSGSLAATVDAVNEAAFLDRAITKTERVQAARFIASRQGLPGSYANMFALVPGEPTKGLRLFTGERVTTRVGTVHILGEEACRALALLDVDDDPIRKALARARAGILERLLTYDSRYTFGTFCCAKCSVGLWRNLVAGGLKGGEARLAAGLKVLKADRADGGRWRRFPFHYTLLALAETDLPAAIAEMRYAAPALERSLNHAAADDKYGERRALLAERVLARC